MDNLVRRVTEMKLSVQIIDGYNKNVQDYCESLVERVKNAKVKQEELKELLKDHYKSLQEQEELLKIFEEKKEQFMSLQSKRFPNGLVMGDARMSDQEHIIKEVTNLEILSREKICNDGSTAKENYNPFFEGLPINSTFTEDNISFVNSTFLKKSMKNLTPKPRSDLEISVNYVANDEFSLIPSYMRGRITMDNINEFINIFNVTLNKKYELIKKNKKNKSKPELEQCLVWKEQEIAELKGSYFCTADDFDKLGNIKIGNKKYMSIITMLRHIKRIKEVRIIKMIYYVACF